MVALPFYTLTNSVKKPFGKTFDLQPSTIGGHIRKQRIERGLLQRDVALLLGTSEDTITGWENGRTHPRLQHYPSIIGFLDYYPFEHETETLSGKLRQIRNCKGLGYQQCASLFFVSTDAIKRWESGKPMLNSRLREVVENEWRDLFKKT